MMREVFPTPRGVHSPFLSRSLAHLLTSSSRNNRPSLPSPQPTSSSLFGPSQFPHPTTSPFPSSPTSSFFPLSCALFLSRLPFHLAPLFSLSHSSLPSLRLSLCPATRSQIPVIATVVQNGNWDRGLSVKTVLRGTLWLKSVQGLLTGTRY